MARQANGNYVQPVNTAAVSGGSISSTAFNSLVSDIGTEITNSLDRGGRSAMTAALPMGNNKITGMADPTVSTDASTKAYVDALIAALSSTGDVKFTIKTAADSGWVLFDDGSIGSAGSGATSRANADTQPLFNLIFNNISDTYAPILTSGGGATTRGAQTNAATAWAANCRISLPKTLGRALAFAGSGSGLTARSLAQTFGEEAHALTLAELPGGLTSSGANLVTVATSVNVIQGATVVSSNATGGASGQFSSASQTNAQLTSVGTNTTNVTSNNTGGGSHNNVQPSVFLNAMIKL